MLKCSKGCLEAEPIKINQVRSIWEDYYKMIMVYYDYILHIITINIVYINIMLSFQIKSQILSPHVKAPDKAAPGMVDSSSIQISCVVFLWSVLQIIIISFSLCMKDNSVGEEKDYHE